MPSKLVISTMYSVVNCRSAPHCFWVPYASETRGCNKFKLTQYMTVSQPASNFKFGEALNCHWCTVAGHTISDTSNKMQTDVLSDNAEQVLHDF